MSNTEHFEQDILSRWDRLKLFQKIFLVELVFIYVLGIVYICITPFSSVMNSAFEPGMTFYFVVSYLVWITLICETWVLVKGSAKVRIPIYFLLPSIISIFVVKLFYEVAPFLKRVKAFGG